MVCLAYGWHSISISCMNDWILLWELKGVAITSPWVDCYSTILQKRTKGVISSRSKRYSKQILWVRSEKNIYCIEPLNSQIREYQNPIFKLLFLYIRHWSMKQKEILRNESHNGRQISAKYLLLIFEKMTLGKLFIHLSFQKV